MEIREREHLAVMIMVPMVNGEVLPLPEGQVCEWCCSWDTPLNSNYANRKTAHGAPLTYVEWLAWHWHVLNHQRGVPLS